MAKQTMPTFPRCWAVGESLRPLQPNRDRTCDNRKPESRRLMYASALPLARTPTNSLLTIDVMAMLERSVLSRHSRQCRRAAARNNCGQRINSPGSRRAGASPVVVARAHAWQRPSVSHGNGHGAITIGVSNNEFYFTWVC